MRSEDLELNRIYHGDSYKLIKEIPDKSIDCIYVDIPYLYTKHHNLESELKKKRDRLTSNITKTQLEINAISNGIDYSIFNDFIRVLRKMNLFIWCSRLQISEILNWFSEKGFEYEILVWCKTNPVPAINNTWLPDIEYCLYFREKGVKFTQGYDLKSKWFISPINQSDKQLFKHPTIKPLELVKRHIQLVTKEGGVVLDCFCGSGTTCVAANEIGRNFIGIEVEDKWYKIAVDRINGITADGQTSIFTDFSL